MVAETPTTLRWGRGEEKAKQLGAVEPAPPRGIRALPGETRRGAATPKAPSKNFGDGEWGYRVFKVKLNRGLRRALIILYNRIMNRDPTLPKSIYYYIESWEAVFANAFSLRRKAGKRTPPRPPPYFLLVKFIKDGKRIHGSDGAPVVVDIDRGELRIPCVGIRIPLTPSLLRVLQEELTLQPKPQFVLLLRYNGKLRIVAKRSPPQWRLEPPVRVIGIDVNSRYGLTVTIFDIKKDGVRMAKSPLRFKPPNDTLYLAEASVLRKISRGLPPTPPRNATEEKRKLWQWALERVKEKERRTGALTTERADRLRRQLEQATRIARQRWARKLLGELRQLIREAGGRAVIAVDNPDPNSLRNSSLQKTYLSATKLIEDLCRYEGALYRSVRASGRRCPLCDRFCEEIEHRYYRCSHCSVVFDRDYGASFRAGLIVLPPALADMLRGWLRKHPRALAPNYGNGPQRTPPPGPTSWDTPGHSRGALGGPRA
ncbi:MAG: hypothetical protein QXJ38_03025 [Thermofilaceae archaeon]